MGIRSVIWRHMLSEVVLAAANRCTRSSCSWERADLLGEVAGSTRVICGLLLKKRAAARAMAEYSRSRPVWDDNPCMQAAQAGQIADCRQVASRTVWQAHCVIAGVTVHASVMAGAQSLHVPVPSANNHYTTVLLLTWSNLVRPGQTLPPVSTIVCRMLVSIGVGGASACGCLTLIMGTIQPRAAARDATVLLTSASRSTWAFSC